MRYIVIGGAGAMGQILVRDLFEFREPGDSIVIADYDIAKARTLAESYANPQVAAIELNVKDHAGAARAMAGAFVVINCVQYQLNLDVMESALLARAHYIDLGGLFHMTRKQLELDLRFKDIGKIAILGMGAAPGITNILSRHAADQLDEVTEIHTRVAGADFTRYKDLPALPVSYSLQTILEEFSLEPAVFTGGKFKFVKPMSGDTPHKFPSPVGIRRPMYTIHSEVATLPLSFKDRGVREVSFKIAFGNPFLDRVRFLRDMGMASNQPVDIGGVRVKPIEVINKVAMSQHQGTRMGKLKQHEIVRAVVKGTRGSKKMTYIVDCHAVGMPKWGIGTDIDTGSPPAIAARMLARGEITGSGALPPEACVPPVKFFAHLKKRKMWVEVKRAPGWKFSV